MHQWNLLADGAGCHDVGMNEERPSRFSPSLSNLSDDRVQDSAALALTFQCLQTTLPRAYSEGGLHHFLDLATNALVEHDLSVPEHGCLDLIVRTALGAQHLYFIAAAYKPTEGDLLFFFEGFVLRCASGFSS
jgi:hypothetical protein